MSSPRVVELTRAATGWDVDERELRAVVARGLSLARLFNLREGASAADDVLPPRLHEPIQSGPLSDRRIAPEEVREIVQSYYVENGWHPDTGAPLRGTLEALEIAEYAPLAPSVVPTDEPGTRLLPRSVTQAVAPAHIEHE